MARESGLAAQACPDVRSALAEIARAADPAQPPVVLVTGSLYLAGDALAENGQSAG
jgi:dihydrofolate synthase/folylpolyglutamate synthase